MDYMTTAVSAVLGLGLYAQDEGAFAVCVVASLLIAAVLYVAGVPRTAHHAGRALRAFANFDRMIVEPVAKFVYLALAVSALVFTVVTLSLQAVAEGVVLPDFAWTVAGGFVALVAYELVVRVAFELLVLFVRAASVLSGDACVPEVAVSARPDPEASRAPLPVDGAAGEVSPARPKAQGSSSAQGAERDGVTVYPRSQAATVPAGTPMTLPVDPEFFVVNFGAEPEEDTPFAGEAECLDEADEASAVPAHARYVSEEETEHMFPVEPTDSHAVFDAQSSVLWNCTCGAVDNYGAFCGYCGTPRPTDDRQAGDPGRR